jgi:signal transduction histidine kinase
MTSDPDRSLVEGERIRSVVRHAPVTLSVTVVNAILTAIVLGPAVGYGVVSIWAALVVAVSIVRWTIRWRFLRRLPEGAQCRPWAVLSVLGSLTTGVLWGGGAVVLFPSAGMYQLFLAFVVAGMCAGATTVNSAHLPTVLAFILPASLPLAASFLVDASGPQVVQAIMIMVFAVALSCTSWRDHNDFGARIRLQLAVNRQRRKLSEANARLSEEVAERRNVEATLQQAQKMEAIGHLTGGIAHDFNNILQVVIGNMELIRQSADGDVRVLGHASAAQLAAERGARLTSSLLAFARRQSLHAERVDLNAVMQEFETILLRALGGTIRFQTIYIADLPMCRVDRAHFQSAILNLVINARDAMPEGGPLSITTGVVTLGQEDLIANTDAKPGRFVAISVQDAGSGMSDDILAHAFEPFFTTKDVGKGSGLGLSQVIGFARQSGGHVCLRSKPEIGTCATLLLPVDD